MTFWHLLGGEVGRLVVISDIGATAGGGVGLGVPKAKLPTFFCLSFSIFSLCISANESLEPMIAAKGKEKHQSP